jgi:AraC family transcriptional regulator of adaptative response/methylated-DNA-[protein]-cysteine methyltransferase
MPDPESCWQAVAARDRSADGRFLYGVRTVGVYCRPGCPSRLPRRENTLFFADARAARAAGFRPCKRCRPDQPTADAHHRQAVETACRMIRAAERPPTLAGLACAVGMSPHHFHRLFRRLTGVTPRDYARAQRLRRFGAGLDGGAPVSDAVYAAGYGSSSRAYADSDRLGMSPATRRRGGTGETIRYAVAPSPLGTVLLAATARGVCAVELGEDADALAATLRAHFPAARIVADPALSPWLDALVGYLDAPGRLPDLPLDLRGTAFQAQVWRALRQIPPGDTLSYGAIAAGLGRPGAARAVGTACAGNRIAVLVPCHRAVRADGGPGGYRWGIARKKALLAGEAAARAKRERRG